MDSLGHKSMPVCSVFEGVPVPLNLEGRLPGLGKSLNNRIPNRLVARGNLSHTCASHGFPDCVAKRDPVVLDAVS